MIGLLGFTSYIIEPKTMSAAMLHIPLINIVAVLKELTLGIYDIGHILIVFGWIIVYIIAAIAFARYMFSKESVIFRT
jgi:sodium transport system permease protein